MNMTDSPFRQDVLAHRVALVSGGGSGLGFDIARQLLLHDARAVVLMGRRQDVLEGAKAKLNAELPPERCNRVGLIAGDVRRPDHADRAVKYTVSEYGSLSILVNAAAGNFLACADQMSTNALRTVVDIDAVGTFNMSRAAFPLLRASKDTTGKLATIINISATLHVPATHYQAHASAAKAAVDSLTRSLALEWSPLGIRVVGIAPGTPGMAKLAPSVGEDAVAEVVRELIPLGRMGSPSDISLAVVYLSTEAASFITGETLIVDGGHYLYKPPLLPREMVAEFSRNVERKSRKPS